MAEGGGKKEEDNPFSFKKFVQKKSSNSNNNANERNPDVADLGQNLPDISASMPNDKADSDDESPPDSYENPFSFKKFLKGDVRSQSGGLTTLDLAHDLPDFVQDHYTSDQPSQRSRNPAPEVQLPDFALELDNAASGLSAAAAVPDDPTLPALYPQNADISGLPSLALDNPVGNPLLNNIGGNNGASVGSGAVPKQQVQLNDDSDSDTDFVAPKAGNSAGGLPDFLSDSAINSLGAGLKNGLSLSDDVLGQEDVHDAEAELKRLRLENRELRKQLNEAREFSETESKRVSAVLQEMETIQKREAEETQALENMIQQVEANLQATTQRAVGAEKTIVKLEREVKTLQGEVSTLQSENSLLKRCSGQDIMRDRAKYASEQLATAATSAEATLKQLMSGVDSLKTVSNILASIDKLTDADVPPSNSGGGAKSRASPASSSSGGGASAAGGGASASGGGAKSRTSPGGSSTSSNNT